MRLAKHVITFFYYFGLHVNLGLHVNFARDDSMNRPKVEFISYDYI